MGDVVKKGANTLEPKANLLSSEITGNDNYGDDSDRLRNDSLNF